MTARTKHAASVFEELQRLTYERDDYRKKYYDLLAYLPEMEKQWKKEYLEDLSVRMQKGVEGIPMTRQYAIYDKELKLYVKFKEKKKIVRLFVASFVEACTDDARLTLARYDMLERLVKGRFTLETGDSDDAEKERQG